jgi:hypothetical protein
MLFGNQMVTNRPLATPAVLAIPISRLLLRGMRGLAGRMRGGSRGLMMMTGIRLAPQATLTHPIQTWDSTPSTRSSDVTFDLRAVHDPP